MSGIFRPETGSKHLNFSGGGGDRKVEFILGGILSVIILGSIALIVWPMFKSDKTEDNGMMKFECIKCGHKFEADTLTPDGDPQVPLPGTVGPPPQKCPECGGDAYPMIQCPECGAWYLPERYKDERTRGVPTPGVEMPRDKCPECGADYIDAVLKKRQKR